MASMSHIRCTLSPFFNIFLRTAGSVIPMEFPTATTVLTSSILESARSWSRIASSMDINRLPQRGHSWMVMLSPILSSGLSRMFTLHFPHFMSSPPSSVFPAGYSHRSRLEIFAFIVKDHEQDLIFHWEYRPVLVLSFSVDLSFQDRSLHFRER